MSAPAAAANGTAVEELKEKTSADYYFGKKQSSTQQFPPMIATGRFSLELTGGSPFVLFELFRFLFSFRHP
jgi:hypothetical protein